MALLQVLQLPTWGKCREGRMAGRTVKARRKSNKEPEPEDYDDLEAEHTTEVTHNGQMSNHLQAG